MTASAWQRRVMGAVAIVALAGAGCGGRPGAGTPQAAGHGPGMKPQAVATLQLPVPRTLDLAHVEPRYFAAALGNDPTRIFEFVRDTVAFEAYPGLLRGARGTLLALAGNSIDRAVLLGAMLEAAGQSVRYVRGTLRAEDAAALVRSMWAQRPHPAPPKPGADVSPVLTAITDHLRAAIEREYRRVLRDLDSAHIVGPPAAAPTVASLDAESRAHYWLQWSNRGTWVDLDPSFADAAPGRSYARVEEQFGAPPERLLHRVSIRVRVEEYAASALGTRDVLVYDATAAELAGAHLTLSHQPENWRGPVGSLQQAMSSAIENTGRIRPVLLVGDRPVIGEVFQQRLSTTGIGSVRTMLGGEGTRNAPTLATAEWVEFEFVSPDGTREREARELFDIVGKARRSTGPPLTPEEVRVRTESERAVDVTQAAYDVFLSGGRIDMAHVAGLAADPPLQEGERSDVRRIMQRMNATFTLMADALLSRFTRPNQEAIVLYPDSPRVQIVEIVRRGDRARVSIDLRRSRLRVVTNGPVGREMMLARVFRGVAEGTLEGAIMEAMLRTQETRLEDVVSTSALFEHASAEGVSSHLLRGDAALDAAVPEDTRARVREELSAGFVVVAPDRPVVVNGAPRFAWWRIDPNTGATIGVADDGLHVSSIEYTIVHNTETNVTYIVANGSVVDAGLYGTEYYVAMMARIVDGLWPWAATVI